MAIGDLSFAFNPERGETPASLEKKRRIAEALAGGAMGRAPRDVGEGLTSLGHALAYRRMMGDINKGEVTGRERAQGVFSGLFGGNFPEAPDAPATETDYPTQRVSESHGDFTAKAPAVISRLSEDLEITPQQAAGIVGQLGHESEGLQAINERNPLVPGSRGGFGWAQWTGPRRRQFEEWAQAQGLDPSDDETNYGFLLHELKNTPESAVLEDIRGAPDAQTAGRVFTDKFLRPGIPGYESRSQWTDQALMAYQSAVEGGATPQQATQAAEQQQTADHGPVQVASLDASAGMRRNTPAEFEPGEFTVPSRVPEPPELTSLRERVGGQPVQPGMIMDPQQTAGIFVGTPEELAAQRQGRLQQPPPSPLMRPESMSGGAPPTLQRSAPPAQRVAQAIAGGEEDGSRLPAIAGGTADVIDPGRPSMQQLVEAASNPWLSEGQKAVVGALLQREMQSSDPMRQLDMDYRRAQIDALNAKAAGEGQLEGPAAFQTLALRARDAGLEPGTPEYQQFMATGGSSPDESAANQRIDRMTENLMATGDFVDPQEAQNIAVGIVDGRLKSDRHPVTGELQIVDMATGRPVYGGRQQPPAPTPVGPEAPALQEDWFGRQFPASNEAFGVPGAIAGGINRASDAIGVGPVYPEIQQSQADFGVLRESLMNDISSAYNRQPPSWLMKEIRSLTPAAGSPFEGPSGAVSKLNALGRHLETELRITESALAQRELSPKNRQELEAKRDGLGAGLERITGAIRSFGDQEQSAPQEAVDMLREDPSPQARREFDEIFGDGAAERVLGGQ